MMSALYPEAQDEVLVAEVRVVLHDVPKDRPVADRHHRLGDVVGMFPEPHAHSSTKQDNLHQNTMDLWESARRTVLPNP